MNPVLPLMLAPHQELTLFIRVASTTVVALNGALWDPLALRGEETERALVRGAFLAALLLAACFAALSYLLLRDRVYLLFALALFFRIGFEMCMTGVMQRNVWPADLPFFSGIITFCSGLSTFFYALFFCAFLELRTRMPFWNRIMLALAGLALLCALGALFHDFGLWVRVMTPTAMAVILLSPALSLSLWRKGYRPARLLTLGWSTLWIFIFVNQAMMLGLLPVWPPVMESEPLATTLSTTMILLVITEHTRELRYALAHAYANDQAKTTFLAHMSHELHTPLNTVIGYARLLRRDTSRVSMSEGTWAIERSGLHLLKMIDELLDYACGDLGKMRLTPAPIAWQAILDAIVPPARMTTQAAGNRFVFDAAGAFPAAVSIDARRLRQVLENLVANANRHTHGGEVKLTCHVSPAVDCEQSVRLYFTVTDTGEGIAPKDMERIFQPFERGTERSVKSDAQGTGLGLPIARQLVAMMGGDLWLEHSSPTGSRFGLAIDCLMVPDAPPAKAANWPAAYAGRRRTVLLADDAAMSRAVLADTLRSVGFDVIKASSGHEAIKRIDAQIDLVLTDQFMHDGCGWGVLQKTRAKGWHIPVVLISATEPQRPQWLPDNLEFDGFIAKPFDANHLFDLLGMLLALEWHAADEVANSSPPTPTYVLPPASRREELARLATAGRVTDIEDWALELAQASHEWADYAARVTDAVRRLDFTTLEQLACSRAAL